MQIFKRALALVILLGAASTQALPIVQADAFTAGDNKAALETSTGLVWMDFGVNAYGSNVDDSMKYSSIVNSLDTTYKGWRLATENEVVHLWQSLFSPINPTTAAQNYVGSNNSDYVQQFIDISDIFGTTWQTVAWFNPSQIPGATVEIPIDQSQGWFQSNNGKLGLFLMEASSKGTEARYSLSLIDSHGFEPQGWEYGAMLVKKDSSVPEPSSLLILSLGLLGLCFGRTRKAK